MTDIYQPRFKNGGDKPSGDVGNYTPVGSSAGVEKVLPSPTFSREELVEVIALSIASYAKCIYAGYHDTRRATDILDALIAIGAVRVK